MLFHIACPLPVPPAEVGFIRLRPVNMWPNSGKPEFGCKRGRGRWGASHRPSRGGQVGGQISLRRRDELSLLPPPLAGEGWGEGDGKCSFILRAPSLSPQPKADFSASG